MFKDKLQQYIQKNSLQFPVYVTSKDGTDHLPQFKCTVTLNGVQYNSAPGGFKHKKEAENAAAQTAIEHLLQQGLLDTQFGVSSQNAAAQTAIEHDTQFGETGEHKQVLNGLATQKNIPPPTYLFTMEGEAHCPSFTAIVEINGAFYTGAPGKNKKEAAGNATYEAIRSMHTQDSNSEKENAEHMSGRKKMLKRKNKRTNKNRKKKIDGTT